jgi:para-nitrobenzyl esterase
MRIRTGTGLIGAALAVTLAVPAGAAAASSTAARLGTGGSPIVQTDRGAVRGVRAAGVDSFLGIRYAAAPIGDLRWQPPQRAARWSGVAPATAYGSRCPAAASTNGPRTETEDCLFVNVQRPAGLRTGDRRPVYVFIHGGGLLNGSSNQADMAAMVQTTGVVGVTFNYRLGVLGFLSVPALTAEAGESGNYGFQDQQAALRWIHRNIARFGGDPARVTLGGESAGGWSVCGHLVAPGSRGLFSQAMIQSGSCLSRTQEQAETAGTAIAAAVGCTDPATVTVCLRGTPTARLIDAPGGGFALVHGTPTLPGAPAREVTAGRFARVPVVIGANRDEGRTFAQGFIGATREQYVTWVRSTFGGDADAVLVRYPWPADADRFTPAYLIGAIQTDAGLVAGIGGCATRRLTRDVARWTPTWAYEFAHRTGPGLTPIPGYVWGAGHAAELAYLFPSFDNGTPIAPTFDAAERRLARDMKRYWGAFTLRGTPNAAGLTRWPRYDRTGAVMSLRAGGRSHPISDRRFVAEHQCRFWDRLAT